MCRDDSEGKRVKRVCAFWDERYCKNRSITDVDWSPKVRPTKCTPDVILCSQIPRVLVSGTQRGLIQ